MISIEIESELRTVSMILDFEFVNLFTRQIVFDFDPIILYRVNCFESINGIDTATRGGLFGGSNRCLQIRT